MGVPSQPASNAIIYLTLGAFLVLGCFVAWKLRHQSKSEWLSSNRTQKGVPLAFNFIASALGSGILFTYPQIAIIAGVQGLLVYALSSALPLLVFGALGPIIRRKCPEGFVLTEWTRQRYGAVAGLFLSVCTLITMFLYMVAELSALQQIISLLTGLNGLPVVIVECAVTTIYTSLGGFKVSFVTDNIQGIMVIGLIIMGVIAVGVETKIDRSLIDKSGYLEPSLLGWQLIYILPVAIMTNDFFLSGFWMLMTISLSAAAFDSFQSAMISTGSNDFFRNKLNIWIIRACVVALIFPVVVVALRSPDILQIFLISDLVSAAVVPCLVIGLSDKFYWYRGFDFVVGGLGGVFTIFLFGLVYYDGDVTKAGKLLLLEGGLYGNDWSAFGAFVAAPFGGLLWAFGACALRISFLWVRARVQGTRFDAFDHPISLNNDDHDGDAVLEHSSLETGVKGRFF
ncbi:hypothetical protein HRS9122_07698 [Pyrenophora teres f. teres]|nr:hypothetical protein HRS9122_07698 [Pyrenophora teres f. teres]